MKGANVVNTYYDEAASDIVHQADEDVIDVVSVIPQNNYALLLTFTTGETKLYDMRPQLDNSLYWPLSNVALFMQAHIRYGTVAWTDEIDICPEELYENSKVINA